jgi:uncharacterized protein (TIGR03083 family)
MQIAQHLDRLDEDGPLLAKAAEQADLDAPVATCPGWQVRDLVHHTGQVHRWALSYVASGRATPPDDSDQPATPPPDAELLAWFRDGHAQLAQALRAAPDDLACWSFLPAPTPRAFWARRQAHETAIHRADAESATGGVPSYDAAFAADGVDELLFGFFARPGGRMRSDPPRRLGLRAGDTGDAWTLTIGPDGRDATKSADDADCVVTGPASDIYLLLWNRGDSSRLSVEGDTDLLTLWRDNAQIKWR